MAEDQIKSRYEVLVVPEFKSTIPAHLLDKLTEQERYLVGTLSKMEQQNAWLVLNCVKANGAMIDLDTRQLKVELWKERLTSKWTVLIGLGVLLAPEIIRLIFSWLSVKKVP